MNNNNSIWTRRGILCVALFVATAAGALFAQSTYTFPINPNATFLPTNNDPGAVPTVPIELSSIGLQPGQEIRLSASGAMAFSQGSAPITPLVLALFSSDGTVAGKIRVRQVGQAVTGTTFYGSVKTLVPGDFAVAQAPNSTKVIVPAGAAYLFLAAADSFYSDNNSSTVEVTLTVVGTADLQLAAYLQADPLLPQGAVIELPQTSTIGYGFAIRNNGPDAAFGVTLDVPIPSGTVFDSASISDDTGTTGTCTAGSAAVSCVLPELGSTASATAVVVFQPGATPIKTTIRITATVSSQDNDPNSSNNKASTPGVAISYQKTKPH